MEWHSYSQNIQESELKEIHTSECVVILKIHVIWYSCDNFDSPFGSLRLSFAILCNCKKNVQEKEVKKVAICDKDVWDSGYKELNVAFTHDLNITAFTVQAVLLI